MTSALRILHAASEAHPLAKTGGLADVVAALPAALRRAGCDARIALPGYRGAIAAAQARGLTWHAQTLTIESGGIDHVVGVGTVLIDGVPCHLLACNELYDRDGIYGPSQSATYDDNARRYAVFCKAVLALPGLLGWIPHIVHAHDWQCGLIPALLERGFTRTLPATRSVLTVHNLAFQGVFAPDVMRLAGFDASLWNPVQCEHFGSFNWLKAGIVFADRVTAVSRTYAAEMQRSEYGYGLDGIVAQHAYKLSGLTNGIDTVAWDPEHDRHLAQPFSAAKPEGKAACKRALRQELGLIEDDTCVVGVVSRLTGQKGIDLIIDVVEPYLRDRRMQLAVLGSGDHHLEHRLHVLQSRHPGQVAVWYGHSEALAHRVIAGSDLFLVPSRYEPCGLTQLYSLRYGTLPLVRFTGGLADTVVDVSTGVGNGFTFGPIDHGHFSSALDRALGLFRHHPLDWRAAMKRAMGCDHSWTRVAREYIELYRRLCVL